MSERKRVYMLEQTVTERYFYDPATLIADFADEYASWQGEHPNWTQRDFAIHLFELHDGSQFCNSYFYNDANPSVGVELVERWDDE